MGQQCPCRRNIVEVKQVTTFQIQCYLGILGYLGPGGQDNDYGPITKAAVQEFQTDYALDADGIVGALTEKMLIAAADGTAFEGNGSNAPAGTVGDAADHSAQYLQPDGCYHIPKGVNVRLTKDFTSIEVQCQGIGCCKETIISKRIMDTAQAIRDEIGEPLEIGGAGGSGYRCPKHNADPSVMGAANSLHLISDAVDIHYRSTAKLKSAAMHHVQDGEIGLYPWGCHVGVWERGYVSQFTGK